MSPGSARNGTTEENSYRAACNAAGSIGPDLPLEELAEALASVSESNRELIELLFWQGRTESEAARELRISQPAISKRLHAVLAALTPPDGYAK